ncbi:MAG: site-specific DNA-methyltransferase [Candidatus Thermoplasmatota archaeon]|nr:site-specific DNA-methyltransferase [Candidatus Thermoplasmatota archaeon]
MLDIGSVSDSVIFGDCRTVLSRLPDSSVDMVFMDPPYHLQLPKKDLKRWNQNNVVVAVRDEWDSFGSFEEYDRFIEEVLVEVKRVLKEKGALWVISTYHSIHRIGKIMQDLGFWILNDVHWVKTNPMPNWLGVRFTNATETLLWALRDKDAKGYTFHRDRAKEFGIGKVGANVWVIPLCTGEERLKNSEGTRLHSTQKPAELLRRVTLTSTNEGDLILDPFAGTGTTGHVARELGRKFIMIEANPDYIPGMAERFTFGAPGPKDKRIKELEEAMAEGEGEEGDP